MASKSKANAARATMGPSAKSSSDHMQELFVPVHGFVHLYPEEVAVLSHPAFQRLRRVRQLGFAHMVFPGAVHTRFEHSIGAVHVVQRIIDNVNRNCHRNAKSANNNEDYVLADIPDPIKMFARLGALLHDIGHVPFGHTLEDELEHIDKHDGPERINRICNIPFPEYKLDDSLELSTEEP
jgi:HD superfamily phosphohydrolase